MNLQLGAHSTAQKENARLSRRTQQNRAERGISGRWERVRPVRRSADAVLTAEEMHAPLREFVTTGRRPTSVAWRPSCDTLR